MNGLSSFKVQTFGDGRGLHPLQVVRIDYRSSSSRLLVIGYIVFVFLWIIWASCVSSTGSWTHSTIITRFFQVTTDWSCPTIGNAGHLGRPWYLRLNSGWEQLLRASLSCSSVSFCCSVPKSRDVQPRKLTLKSVESVDFSPGSILSNFSNLV